MRDYQGMCVFTVVRWFLLILAVFILLWLFIDFPFLSFIQNRRIEISTLLIFVVCTVNIFAQMLYKCPYCRKYLPASTVISTKMFDKFLKCPHCGESYYFL